MVIVSMKVWPHSSAIMAKESDAFAEQGFIVGAKVNTGWNGKLDNDIERHHNCCKHQWPEEDRATHCYSME